MHHSSQLQYAWNTIHAADTRHKMLQAWLVITMNTGPFNKKQNDTKSEYCSTKSLILDVDNDTYCVYIIYLVMPAASLCHELEPRPAMAASNSPFSSFISESNRSTSEQLVRPKLLAFVSTPCSANLADDRLWRESFCLDKSSDAHILLQATCQVQYNKINNSKKSG